MLLAIQFLVVAVLSLIASGEQPSSEDIVRLLKTLRNHVYFDHILILTATKNYNCSIAGFVMPHWSGMGDDNLSRLLHEGRYTVRTQRLQKEMSRADIASTSLAIKGPCDGKPGEWTGANDFLAKKEALVRGLRTYLLGKYSGGNTPLILMPFPSEHIIKFLELWWLDTDLSQLNLHWLMIRDDSRVRLPEFYLGTWNSWFMLASWSGHSAKISEFIPTINNFRRKIYHLGDLQSNVLNWTKLNFYSRRSDLTGYTIITTTIHDPPFSYVRKGKQDIGGIAGTIWKILTDQLNLRSEYKEFDEHIFPRSAMVALNVRWQIKDDTRLSYTSPVFRNTFRLFVKHPDVSDMVWNRLSAPFSFNLWIMIGATVIFAAACIFVLLKYEFHLKPALHTVPGALLTAIGAFCQQHPKMQMVTPRSRLVYLVIHLTTLVLLATYWGSVISLIISSPTPVLRSIQQITESDSLPILITKESASMYVSKTSNDTILKKLFRRRDRKQHHVPKTATEGLVRVCENQYAVFANLERVEYMRSRIKCQIVSPTDFSLHFPVSFPVSKDFMFVRILNHKITSLRSSGILKKLLKPTRQNDGLSECEDFCSVTFTNVLPHFCLLGTGIFLSLLFLFAEQFIASRNITYKEFLH